VLLAHNVQSFQILYFCYEIYKDKLCRYVLCIENNQMGNSLSNEVAVKPVQRSAASIHYIVIGAGPVGLRFIEEMLRRDVGAHITLLGNEAYEPYDRVKLSGVLARNIDRHSIQLTLPSRTQAVNFRYCIASVTRIDRNNKLLTDSLGNKWEYEKLILAVGARPFLPSIPGNNLSGVYTFRNLKDTDALCARMARAQHVVVVGGGLLGLEAAKALRYANTKVTLVHQGEYLMNRQLDARAANFLLQTVQELDIWVQLGSGVRAVLGDSRTTGVITRDGSQIECDTVLFCTGISPNIELAIKAKLAFGKGIQVNSGLQSSDASIFAIGECCEYEGVTYGLVAPGYEQAAVLADRLTGGSASYTGSMQIARLKVVGEDVISMGEVAQLPAGLRVSELSYKDHKNGIYRKLILQKNRLKGVVALGGWNELPRLQDALQQARKLHWWQRLAFRMWGNPWPITATDDITQWPAAAIVCQCNRVDVASLIAAVDAGNSSVESLQRCTRAGTVCGSCKPLLAELASDTTSISKDSLWLALFIVSLAGIAMAFLVALTPAANVANSVQEVSWFERIWNDKLYKQVSGFSLLGLLLLASLMSLRKRWSRFSWGNYSGWRLLHSILGLTAISGLILHSGFNLGANLNRWLALNFIAVIVLGAFTGIAVAIAHHLSAVNARRSRSIARWLHIIVSWPLPVLLALHITSVYYF
jgi:nitrite reductase (NADH) large subunit